MLCNLGHECDINPWHYSPFNWSQQTKTKYCDQFICLFVYLMGLCSFDERSCYMVRAFYRPNDWAWFESWRFLMLKANRCYLQWNPTFVHRLQFLWFLFVLCLFFYILYNFANNAGMHIHTKSQTSQYNQQLMLMWDHSEYVVIQMWKVCATQFFMVFNDMSFGIFPNRYDLSHLQRVWLRMVVLVLLSNADTIFDLFLSPFNSKKNIELFSCSFYIVEMGKNHLYAVLWYACNRVEVCVWESVWTNIRSLVHLIFVHLPKPSKECKTVL